MIIKFYWNDYKYFAYEKDLARREVEYFFKPVFLEENSLYLSAEMEDLTTEQEEFLDRLTFFKLVELGERTIVPIQKRLEDTQGNVVNRQVTRYAAHGIHEYKGKFNPQIVRSIINILGLNNTSKVIDPFSGSGTTILECSFQNIKAIGLDINPLAVMIGNAKQVAMKSNVEIIRDRFNIIINEFQNNRQNFELTDSNSLRGEYLIKWFPLDTLKDIELLRAIIEDVGEELKDIYYVLLSNIIREYSLQEPADLRIRRRNSPFPETPLLEVFRDSVEIFINKIRLAQEVLPQELVRNEVILCDSRLLHESNTNPLPLEYFDAGITSPPYATALPYIDTQRLSLVWLSLVEPRDVILLESELIGSREFKKIVKKDWMQKFLNNDANLSAELFNYCMDLQNALAETDGFRRQAVPVLLYRYLADMKLMFQNLLPHFKNGGKYALVVGHNQTTLGGTKFDINTPKLLVQVAKSVGWRHDESIELQTYQRYGIHHKNAVKFETLIILKK